MNDLVFTVIGYHTRQQRNVSLNFLCETMNQARRKCQQLHPDVDIYFIALKPENN
jgi:hypothetical protein